MKILVAEDEDVSRKHLILPWKTRGTRSRA
jgi:hypothetical protein